MTYIINNMCKTEESEVSSNNNTTTPPMKQQKDFRARLYARVGVAKEIKDTGIMYYYGYHSKKCTKHKEVEQVLYTQFLFIEINVTL